MRIDEQVVKTMAEFTYSFTNGSFGHYIGSGRDGTRYLGNGYV